MDSLTQMLLGGCVAAACVPPGQRRRALLAGAALGTLPDLDALPLLLVDDPVLRMTWHRGPSHSLLVLPLLGHLLWWLARRTAPVRAAPRAWWWAIVLALVTHALLDALTVYGTQVWWPLPVPPVMVSSLFIIDPLYTVWLLLAVAVAALAGPRRIAGRALAAGLVLSTAYAGASLLAKAQVERAAEATLAAAGLADAPRFSVPMPFNILLWRVVVLTPDGFLEGERSLVADRAPMRFRAHDRGQDDLAAVAHLPAVRRLAWFNHGFMKAWRDDDRLVLSDLRMGAEPTYTFNFAVARAEGTGWQAIPPEQVRQPLDARRRLAAMWQRIWHAPDASGTGRGDPHGAAPTTADGSP
ncbi:MAG: metal-dependent hydrolase [Pseudoxanthomonas sp.]|nr:metal-dependent hydrolase [Pseudoxanthomonas sp.]